MAFWSGLLARPARTPLHDRPSLTLFFLLAGVFLLTLFPQAPQFPIWLTATILVAMVLRAIIEVYRLPLPSTTLSGFLALVFLGLIFVQYNTVAGRDAGTAFIAGLLAIKFYEIRRPRDVALVIFACFFVVMSSLLYSQALELFIYCLIMMWILTALLLRVHAGDSSDDRLLRMLGISSLIFMEALPLMLFLFLFFPRYNGTITLAMTESKIGITDTVSPGSIAKLASDDSEAMYVEFTNGKVPTNDSMYMRGIVLWDYANGVWTPGEVAAFPSPKIVSSKADEINQRITLLAHNQKWLFALDVPVTVPESSDSSWATMLNGNIVQLAGTNKLNHQVRYTVSSSYVRAEETLTNEEWKASWRLPKTPTDFIDPGVIHLADSLYKESNGQELPYIDNVLKYFHRAGFTYTTAPGELGPEWLPTFLLKTKAGFCEHFASAFAVLMRLEKIRARVVVGYLGSDYNPYSNQYVVAQSNAHAWDEVWFPSNTEGTRGHWEQVDPTSIVGSTALGQLETRAADANDDFSRQLAQHQPTFAERYLPLWARSAMREFQLRREQVEANWDDLVFSYDPEVQTRLAEALGFGNKAAASLLGLCVVTCLVWFLGFRKWMARKPHVMPIENIYAAFCRNMAQRGIPRATWEGPLSYTNRVAEAFPDDKSALQQVGSIVARARYGPAPPTPTTADDLKALLDHLSASEAASISRERS